MSVCLLRLWLLVTATLQVTINAKPYHPPHIVLILADDLGWNYVSWHNESVITPNMQELVDNGVELDQSYVQPVCSPSRSALMTGMYPYHIGRQDGVIRPNQPTGVSLDYTFLPEKLRDLGYNTHVIGKWHMGFCDWDYTPLRRGFDTFYGFYTGEEDYYKHTRSGGYDFREQENIEAEANMTYSTDLFTARAVDIILSHQHLQLHPMFMYIPYQNIHTPYEVPSKYSDMYPNVEHHNTKRALGSVTAMDEGIGLIVDALKYTGMYNNTIIIFSSDNGGTNGVIDANLPLHGYKGSVWEGGTKGAAFIHSPLLENTPRVYNEALHITDWYNTLLSVAGAKELPDNDGYDQWEALQTGTEPSPRQDMVYNINGFDDDLMGAIRVGDHKYIYNEKKDNDGGDTWLVNLVDDPSEQTNLMESNPELALEMHSLFLAAAETQVPADKPSSNPDGHPENFGGFWTPGWCEAK